MKRPHSSKAVAVASAQPCSDGAIMYHRGGGGGRALHSVSVCAYYLTTVLCLLACNSRCSSSSKSHWCIEATSSIPRSTNARSIDPNNHNHRNSGSPSPLSSSSTNEGPNQQSCLPPWNPSPQIDRDGFLASSYCRVEGEWESEANIGGKHRGLDEPVKIRQVPGDGNCLFHSITVAMAAVVNGTHIDMAGTRSRVGRRVGNCRVSRLAGVGGDRGDDRFREIERDDDLYALDCDVYDDYDQYDQYDPFDFEPNDADIAFDLNHLHHHSTLLRQKAVNMLSLNPRRLLFLQGNEYLRARDLVDAAAAQYDLDGDEYCDLMRKESYWGGGPEIVALSNVLRRPIHVYELSGESSDDQIDYHQQDQYDEREVHMDKDGVIKHIDPNNNHHNQHNNKHNNNPNTQEFRLRRMACFGSPKFDRRQPLHILSADSRFPDVSPGDQLPSGNHFMALFPDHCIRSIEEAARKKHDKGLKKRTRRRSAGVRGGFSSGGVGVVPNDARHDSRHDGVTRGRHRRSRRRKGGGDLRMRDTTTDRDKHTNQHWDNSRNRKKGKGKRQSFWGALTSYIAPMYEDTDTDTDDGPLRSIFQFAVRLFLRV